MTPDPQKHAEALAEHLLVISAGAATLATDDLRNDVKRLVSANRLLLSWRFGLLAGRGEADFDLAGLGEAVDQIAGTCNADPP